MIFSASPAQAGVFEKIPAYAGKAVLVIYGSYCETPKPASPAQAGVFIKERPPLTREMQVLCFVVSPLKTGVF